MQISFLLLSHYRPTTYESVSRAKCSAVSSRLLCARECEINEQWRSIQVVASELRCSINSSLTRAASWRQSTLSETNERGGEIAEKNEIWIRTWDNCWLVHTTLSDHCRPFRLGRVSVPIQSLRTFAEECPLFFKSYIDSHEVNKLNNGKTAKKKNRARCEWFSAAHNRTQNSWRKRGKGVCAHGEAQKNSVFDFFKKLLEKKR